MGTAGPLKLAEEILSDGSGEPFFVLNRCGCHNKPLVCVSTVNAEGQVLALLVQQPDLDLLTPPGSVSFQLGAPGPLESSRDSPRTADRHKLQYCSFCFYNLSHSL